MKHKYKYATIDIETTGLNRYKDEITWIGIGLAEDIDSDLDKIYIYEAADPKSMRKFHKRCAWLKDHKVKCI